MPGKGNDPQLVAATPLAMNAEPAGEQPRALTVATLPYRDWPELLELIEGEAGERIRALYAEHWPACAAAAGSSHNHQAWTGGYWDHLREVLNLACVQYASLSACRPLPPSRADSLDLHDAGGAARAAGVPRHRGLPRRADSLGA